jgi:SapC
MTNHQILNPVDHADLRIHVGPGEAFGDRVMACIAVPFEFRRLANDYPILFRYDPEQRSFSALALMGFEPDENLFLDDQRWHAAAKPLALAIQPFLVGRSRDPEGPGQVHIDLDHPRIAHNGEGVRLFDDAGQPTPHLEQAIGMLGELDGGHRASASFFAALDRHDLLEPFSLDVSGMDGGEHRLVGYHLIDEEKLRGLDPAAVAELHAAGHLMPLFMALASLGNLAKLARRRASRGDD